MAQAIVDHRCVIRGWCCGFPGGYSDLKVLRATQDRHWIADLKLFGGFVLKGIQMSYYILGDGIYGLSSTIMVPFKGSNLTAAEEWFNYWQSSQRMVVERTFGILKGKAKDRYFTYNVDKSH